MTPRRMGYVSGAGEAIRSAHEAARKTDKRRNSARSQQSPIITLEPPVVFSQTEFQQFRQFDSGTDPVRPGHSEIVVLRVSVHVPCNREALPNQECPNRESFEHKRGFPPPWQIAAMPRRPIEEEDVPTLLLHHRLDRFDQLGRKKSRTAGDLKQTEGEKAVDAFAIASHHESPFRIAPFHILWFLRQRYAVHLLELSRHVLMADFLKCIHSDP